MRTLKLATISLALLAWSGSALALDRCAEFLSGNTYLCDFTFSNNPGDVLALGASFGPPVSVAVLSELQGTVGGIVFACSCAASGKPGKLKSAAKSLQLTCIEARTDGSPNNEVLNAKVARKGAKIIKGRYMENAATKRTGVFTCEKS